MGSRLARRQKLVQDVAAGTYLPIKTSRIERETAAILGKKPKEYPTLRRSRLVWLACGKVGDASGEGFAQETSASQPMRAPRRSWGRTRHPDKTGEDLISGRQEQRRRSSAYPIYVGQTAGQSCRLHHRREPFCLVPVPVPISADLRKSHNLHRDGGAVRDIHQHPLTYPL